MGSGSLSTVLTCTEIPTSEGACICVKQMWAACLHTCMHSSLHQRQRCICYIGMHKCHESFPHTCKGAGTRYSVAGGESVTRQAFVPRCADLDGMRGGGPPDGLPPALHDAHLLAPDQKAPCLQLLDCSAP